MAQGDLIQGLEQGGVEKPRLSNLSLAQTANFLAIFVNIGAGALSFWLGQGFNDGSEPTSAPAPATSISYLQPSQYAFAIWPLIYAGEIAFAFWQSCAFQKEGREPESRLLAIQNVALPYTAAHVVTCIWDFLPDNRLRAAALAVVGIFLGIAHGIVAPFNQGAEFYLMTAPITLHFGWMVAAFLVTTNTVIAQATDSVSIKFGALLVSLTVAAGTGMFLAARRNSGLLAGTVAWAIIGVGVATLLPATQNQAEAAYNQELGEVGRYMTGIAELFVGGAMLGYAVTNSRRMDSVLPSPVA